MSDKDTRSNIIPFRATDKELDLYKKKAEEMGTNLSTLIRIALITYITKQ